MIPKGNRWVALGDSVTAGGDAVYAQGDTMTTSWPTYAALLSLGRLLLVYNAGIGGTTSAHAVARFDSEVAAYRPDIVSIAVGTNDTASGVSLTAFQANIRNLVGRTKAIGAVPILCSMPPNTTGSPSNRTQQLTQFNRWQRHFAAEQGIPFVDFHALLVNPANGQWKAGINANATHPGNNGYFAMGQQFSTQIGPTTPPWTPPMINDNSDPESIIFQGCFTSDTNADGVGDSWTGVLPSGQVASIAAGASPVCGNWQRLTATASAGLGQVYGQANCAPNIRYGIAGRIQTSGFTNFTGASVKATVKTSGGTVLTTKYALKLLDQAIADGIFYTEVVTPSNAGLMVVELDVASGTTGWAQVAQVTAYPLAAIGSSGLLI